MDSLTKAFIAIILVLVIFIVSFITFAVVSSIRHQEWLDSLTPEERQEYELQRKQIYESNLKRYDIISVHKYVKHRTTRYGAVKGTDICYNFTYMKGDSLKEISDFQHLEYGLTKVIIGDKNQYIIDSNGEDVRYLQLTKETLENIGGLN